MGTKYFKVFINSVLIFITREDLVYYMLNSYLSTFVQPDGYKKIEIIEIEDNVEELTNGK